VETKKEKKARELLSKLFEIGLPDQMQSEDKLEFLIDQRGERKSRLPPIIGKLGVERRKEKRDAAAQSRQVKEQERAADRFQTRGNSICVCP
jgi:hypothetical protein